MEKAGNTNPALVEGEDYYLENGLMVFTARYHLRRGYCCDSNCRHCPYEKQQSTSKLPGLFRKILGQTENCESCGEPFVCGASLKGCWCTEVELTDTTRHTLRSKFTNCVCRNCLEKAEAEAGGTNAQE
jgi:Family of unknown function (DUF5522)/Cysteine-rich CWC